jgi:two-component system, chemotaxis family, chemotaxis protein CheY
MGGDMPTRGAKVFMIENSAFICAQITSILECGGAQVRTCNNPAKAMLEIVHWHPDIIISSVNIGEITGFDLCLLLKMMPEQAGIPFIILSSNESEDIKSQMASVGADAYIPKDSHIAKNAFNVVCEVLKEKSHDSATSPMAKAGMQNGDHVLVVDDSAVMRRIICNILSSLGMFKIVQAQDGKDALKQLDNQICRMVLTDWNMPLMNGLELVKAIRSKPEISHLPIIMITTEGAHAERKEAELAGVNDLLPKPFTRDQFRHLLQKYL